MHVKTLTGPSIHEALIEARKQFGDDVMLLESKPKDGIHPAQITVMIDATAPATSSRTASASEREPAQKESARQEQPRQRQGFGYGRRQAKRPEPVASARKEPEPRPAPPRPKKQELPALSQQLFPFGPDGEPGGELFPIAPDLVMDPPSRASTPARTETPPVAAQPEAPVAYQHHALLAPEPSAAPRLEPQPALMLDQSLVPTGDGASMAYPSVSHPTSSHPTSSHSAASGSANPEHVPVRSSERFLRQNAPSRGLLFPVDPTDERPPPAPMPDWKPIGDLLDQHVEKLVSRLERIEERLGDAVIGAGHAWIAHPLYSALLQQKMRPGTVARLFNEIAMQGFCPDDPADDLRHHVAQRLHAKLDFPATKLGLATLLFMGPSGAGKTSLILKLAKHPNFYGSRETAVLVILPPEGEDRPYHSPVDLYRQHGLRAYPVRTADDMVKALGNLRQYDQLMIDTPPMPVRPAAARKMMLHVKSLVAPIVPLHVQLVMNTTRIVEHFSPTYIEHLPLRPQALALTHLDETMGWGRIAEWMIRLGLPVHFASTQASLAQGLESFSPQWFTEAIMNL